MPHYNTFDELIPAVLLLQQVHPNWTRLDGNKSGGNRTVFATFHYADQTWKIHADTRIDQLLEAWKMAEAGEEPFQVVQTKQGTPSLRLSGASKANGLYIYLKK